jgi:hypothetical protein
MIALKKEDDPDGDFKLPDFLDESMSKNGTLNMTATQTNLNASVDNI